MILKNHRRKQERKQKYHSMCQLILIKPKIKKRKEPLLQQFTSKIKNSVQDYNTDIPFTFKPR